MTNDRRAVFSPCKRYRYTLWRHWNELLGGDDDSYANFLCLNPSVATDTVDDNTIRRCIAYAKAWGYGGMSVTNIFAWRDTKPSDMKRSPEPIGKDNDEWILKIAKDAGVVVAAWGANGAYKGRDLRVMALLRDANIKLHCLRRTASDFPEHPLYLPKILTPIPYGETETATSHV